MISEEILKILACPACPQRPPVKKAGEKLVCSQCGRTFPVIDGIAVMLLEEGGPVG